MKRRNFFKNSGRWLILGGIGAVSAYLAINGKVTRASECSVSSVCNNCRKFTACNLPQAEKQRNNGR